MHYSKDVIEIFTTLGIISNCILLFTSGTMKKLLPSLGNIEIIVIVIIIEVNIKFHKLKLMRKFSNYF